MKTFTLVVLGALFLAGCSRDADSTRQPGQSFLRPGGDVVIGGSSNAH
jgi:uncharacterized protein YcfL